MFDDDVCWFTVNRTDSESTKAYIQSGGDAQQFNVLCIAAIFWPFPMRPINYALIVVAENLLDFSFQPSESSYPFTAWCKHPEVYELMHRGTEHREEDGSHDDPRCRVDLHVTDELQGLVYGSCNRERA